MIDIPLPVAMRCAMCDIVSAGGGAGGPGLIYACHQVLHDNRNGIVSAFGDDLHVNPDAAHVAVRAIEAPGDKGVYAQ